MQLSLKQHVHLWLWQRTGWLRRWAWTMRALVSRAACQLGWHWYAKGGTYRRWPDLVTIRWCPGGCGRRYEQNVGQLLTDAEVFERDVLRPLLRR